MPTNHVVEEVSQVVVGLNFVPGMSQAAVGVSGGYGINLGADFHFDVNQWALGTDPDFGASQLVLGGAGRGLYLGEVAGTATVRGYPEVMVSLMGAVLALMFLLLFKQLANNKIINSNDNNEKSVQA